MNKLFKIVFFICLNTLVFPISVLAEKQLYRDEEIKVYFTLDKETHEACIGVDGSSSEGNALIYPEIGSPEWDTNFNSKWNNIVFPEKIFYEDEEYVVTSVTSNAFYKTLDIKQISLPSTIRRIGAGAFGYCVNLVDFDFPDDLEYIGEDAFALCRNIIKTCWLN